MKLSDLKQLLEGRLAPDIFRGETEAELRDYERGAAELGRSMPIHLSEDVELLFTKDMLRRLSTWYLEDVFGSTTTNYIVNALLLAESVRFEKLILKEFLEEISDSEVNGPLTKERVVEMMVTLGNE